MAKTHSYRVHNDSSNIINLAVALARDVLEARWDVYDDRSLYENAKSWYENADFAMTPHVLAAATLTGPYNPLYSIYDIKEEMSYWF